MKKLTSLVHLKENICYENTAVTMLTCRAVIGNFTVQLNECCELEGLQLDDIIFNNCTLVLKHVFTRNLIFIDPQKRFTTLIGKFGLRFIFVVLAYLCGNPTSAL